MKSHYDYEALRHFSAINLRVFNDQRESLPRASLLWHAKSRIYLRPNNAISVITLSVVERMSGEQNEKS